MRPWLSALALALLATPACKGDGDEITGGFDELIIDRSIRGGTQVQVADMDKDGDLDVVLALAVSDAVHVYLNPGQATEPWPVISISGPGTIVAAALAVIDVDGDGDSDVVAAGAFQRRAGPTSPGEITWYESPGDPNGVWQTHPITGPSFYGPTTLSASDLDGDGKSDLLIGATPVTLDNMQVGGGMSWLKNNGTGFDGPFLIDDQLRDVSQILATDLDRDGAVDLLVTTAVIPSALDLYHREGNDADDGPRFVKYQIPTSTTVAFSGLVTTNLDADPEDELLVGVIGRTASSVYRYDATTLPAGPFTETVLESFGNGTDRPVMTLGDFDGDGRSDFALATAASGSLRVYQQRDDGFERREVRVGYTGLLGLGAGDVDKDGKLDLITCTTGFGSFDRLVWWKNYGE